MLVPSCLINFKFLIFRADLLIFFNDSESEIIKTFAKLFLSKNLLNSLVFLISVFTSAKIYKFLSEFFFDKVCAKAIFLTFLLIFLIL